MGVRGWVWGLVIGLIWAVSGAIVWDALKTGSVAGVRQLRNWLSGVSVSRLRTRISQIEAYRNQIASFGSSDKALYLAVLQHVIAMLTLICLTIILFIIEYAAEVGPFSGSTMRLGPRGALAILGATISFIAAVLGINGMSLGLLNTPETVSKKVKELDSEIAGLRSRLDARTRALP